MGRARNIAGAAWVAAMLLIGPRPALGAAPDEKERRNTARGLADYANKLVSSGNYEGAIAAFKQADQIYHAPTLVFALARANAKAHHLLAARDLYKQVIAEVLRADAPDEFRAAQATAKDELATVVTMMPTLEVRVRGAGAGPGLQLAVDDKPFAQGEPADLDPGKHVIKVSGGSGDPRTRSVELAERAHQILEIDLDSASDGGPPSVVPGAVIVGVGGLGLIIGAVAGAVTLHQAAGIRATCAAGNVCPSTDMSKVSSANTVAAVSTTGFVVAGVGGVVGTILLVRAVRANNTTVSAGIGPASLMLRGSF